MHERDRFSHRAYLLKMALNGMIVNIGLEDVRECSRLLRNVGNNVNQIAKRVNEDGNLYDDLADIQNRLDEIWKQMNAIIKNLTDILEVA